MIALKANSQPLTELAKRASDANLSNEAAAVGGRAVKNFLFDYLLQLDDERPNQLGGQRTHFYADAARSVQNPTVDAGVATVVINHQGLAQRFFGGVIRAGIGVSSLTGRPTKYLAIPARAESYGRAPSEFADLEFRPTRRGGMLVQALQTQITTGKKMKNGQHDFSTTTVGGLAMYWLVPSVNQRPDPTILPGEKALAGAAAQPMEDYLNRKLSGGGN